MNPHTSELVYLKLTRHERNPHLAEHPLLKSLKLNSEFDDERLMIALGEVCSSDRPITPRWMTVLGPLLILWLSEDEWLALPHHHYQGELVQAIEDAFDSQLLLEPIPDGSFQAELNETNRQQLQQAITAPLNQQSQPAPDITSLDSLCIRPWNRFSSYELLLPRTDVARLEKCLARQLD